MSYSKLHSSLVNSSLWTQPDNVRILFISLLSMCDQYGEVQGSRSGLERIANIRIVEGQTNPWEILLGPDPESSDKMRNPGNEGRRIEEISGGFRILNYGYYCMLRNEDDRREQNRQAQIKHRLLTVSKCQHASAHVSNGQHSKPTETYTQTDTNTNSIYKLESDGDSTAHSRSSRPIPAKKSNTINEDLISELSGDPAYRGIDVPRIYAKMVRWYSERGRKPTRRRLIAWLNKEDPAISKIKPKLRDVTFDK